MPATSRPARLLTACGLAATVLAAAALAASGAAGAASGGAKPGRSGAAIVLGRQLSMTGDSTDLTVDRQGTAYVGWISSATSGGLRSIHECTLPLGASKCQGGIQTIDAIGDSSAAGLRVLDVRGTITLLWLHDTPESINGPHNAEIAAATIGSNGALTDGVDITTAPSFGALLDAEVAPTGAIWTVAYAGLPTKQVEVREGITNPPVAVHTPYGIGYLKLAFAGSTPILGITSYGSIGTPPAYSYQAGSQWTAFKKVAKTWAVGTDIGLTQTSSGVRLITAVGDASYSPVVAKWNGHGFTKPVLTGDRNSCAPSSHDVVSDASGRLVDVSNECGQLTVANLQDTRHAAIFRFPSGGTNAGPAAQIATTPRGRGWVAWGIEDTVGDNLLVAPILLAGRDRHTSAKGKGGRVTVSGPVSCQPASDIHVAVKGHPAKGWKVAGHALRLDGHKVGSTLHGAALTPGKKFTLKGSVTFTGGGHATVSASLSFKACPRP